jgi:D-sedoheptulose 7-phosphate isomerase
MRNIIKKEIESHIDIINSVSDHIDEIINVTEVIISSLEKGNTIYLCGNGGSAGDSQHIAAELTGRFKSERDGLPAIALTTDTSAITAIANDYSFDDIFSRQFKALAKKGDVLVTISTSGNSKNLLKAVEVAKKNECKSIGLIGKDGGLLKQQCNYSVHIRSNDTARIQEAHIMVGHIICGIIDRKFS